MRRANTPSRARGFTLVEVMVAVIVICIGLLGIAKMQALALSNMTASRLRSLAAIEAASLAASMHSNRNYWANNPPLTTVLNPAGAPVVTSTDGALQAQAITDMVTPNACVGSSGGGAQCTAVQLAGYDVASWLTDVEGLLPNSKTTISCPAIAGNAAPPACTIQITWNEVAVAMTSQEAAQQATGNNVGQAFDTPTYTLYVEP
ncbi:MAG TPA: prepilin-type N-terminal cleavage/methylation domain-containing protein [Steroidobacteraceae bacterium]|jgi:type IV pilus assembly protein PilV|nr:prepilin-type N-terminal cleavage/methylation domain-containing protein [Steroidobacteraceae bacterium]